MLDNLSKYHVLLASKSPRRRELLAALRVPFDVVTAGQVDEKWPDDLSAHDVPQYLSVIKANAFRKLIRDNELIITADTVVVCDGEILGKPSGAEEAKKMLRFLSGRTHEVVTGVTITTIDRQTSFTTVTDVKFAKIADEDINYYVENFAPFDKAGAYGIQEWIGCVAVESINGSYYNVMGLPVHTLYHELKLF